MILYNHGYLSFLVIDVKLVCCKRSLCNGRTLVIVYAERAGYVKVKISLKLFKCHFHFILNKNEESRHVCSNVLLS